MLGGDKGQLSYRRDLDEVGQCVDENNAGRAGAALGTAGTGPM